MSASGLGTTIRIFLVDGSPQGPRLVERLGWTGCCLAFARADYGEARARQELSRTGVYVLVGPDPDGRRQSRVYVGEGDEVRTRLDAHQKEKDFWTSALVLTTKDESLNKAHIRYLESRLIALATRADVAVIDNGTAPPLPRLSEPEIADMEAYLGNFLILFPLVGVTAFDVIQPETQSGNRNAASTGSADASPGIRYYLKTVLTEAEGFDDARGFLVLEGSKGRLATNVMTPTYQRVRDELMEEGVLTTSGEQVVMTRDYLFVSPSAAASVLSGGSKNGRTEWRDEFGRSLKENQERSATSPSHP